MRVRRLASPVLLAASLAGAACSRTASTPKEDESACAKGDQAACGRRLERMRVACDARDVSACLALGEAYFTPLNAPKDDAQAALYYERACELGSGRGCKQRAFMLDNGLGGPRDLPAERRFDEKACALGEPSSCRVVATCLERGDVKEGCPTKDLAKARALFARYCELERLSELQCDDVARIDRVLGQPESR